VTLILTRTSALYSLMVTDRLVTSGGHEFDPDANKNILFGDKNGVASVAYTGMAYIGSKPTDHWLAETLTGLTFREGRRGRGSPPAVMCTDYPTEYLRVRLHALWARLQDVGKAVDTRQRASWKANSFDVVVSGYEWNHGDVRPVVLGLSKPRHSETFELTEPEREWHLPRSGRWPARTSVGPAENLSPGSLQRISAQIDGLSLQSGATFEQVVEGAEQVFVDAIRDSARERRVVGPDLMSIGIPPPTVRDRTVSIRYRSAYRNRGAIVGADVRIPVSVAFTPWILSPGCIQAPSVVTGGTFESTCGPYRVQIDAPQTVQGVSAMSSQERPRLK
jgi:hypothetical protein